MTFNAVCGGDFNPVPPEFQHLNFSNINTDNPDFKNAVLGLTTWTNQLKYQNCFKPVVLYGPPGSGKTLLACCTLNSLLPVLDFISTQAELTFSGTADKSVFITGSEIASLNQNLNQKECSDGRTYEQHLYHLKNAFFAVLDDVDKCPVTDTVSARLFSIIDARICQNSLPTVITTNSAPKQLSERYGQAYGDPMVDRLKRKGAVFIRLPRR